MLCKPNIELLNFSESHIYALPGMYVFRGARASIKDYGGLSVLERAMEMGGIKDEELFVLLTKSE